MTGVLTFWRNRVTGEEKVVRTPCDSGVGVVDIVNRLTCEFGDEFACTCVQPVYDDAVA